MKITVAISLLVSALAEAHCKYLPTQSPAHKPLTITTRHLPQHRKLGRLAIRPHNSQLPKQQPRHKHPIRRHAVLPAQPRRRRPRHPQRNGRLRNLVQRQVLHLTPRPHGLLHRQGPRGPDSSDVGRQRQGVVQDLPGPSDAGRLDGVAFAGLVPLSPFPYIRDTEANTSTKAPAP